ncbi:MAG: secretion protein Por, partial [Bacteroidaceae bacterium]|nr:secretion protein Por [Bacteroidaceae bacterium]
MKLVYALTISAFALGLSASAQSVPTHDAYVKYGTPADLVASLKAWEKGKAWGTAPEDENFFISRVPVKQRFLPGQTANPNLNETNAKNFTWCVPTGEMTKKWGPLPRYNFDGDNFNLWQYVKYHSNWSNGWWRVPGAFNDVAHKNGVQTGCTYFIDWGASVGPYTAAGKPLWDLSAKVGGNFVYAEKLVDFLHYYGIDGLTFNPEGQWGTTLANQFKAFLAECHRIAKEKGYTFRVDWYAFVLNTGRLSDNSSKLDANNDEWFHNAATNQPVTDMYFLNYNWREAGLQASVETAQKHGRSSFDVYAGFDQQASGYGANGTNAGWATLMKYPVSIVVWGAHDRSQLYISSTEGGQSDYAVQNEYQKKQEMLFSGGNRNVLALPALKNDQTTASFADLQKWHGYATAVQERSTLNETPFVTRFNLGNGAFMNNEGQTTWAHKWYNIGMQDLLPTWRWWIDNGDGRTVPAQSLQADFTYDDAWFGGSCLKLHGATDRSDMRLFATQWKVESAGDVFRMVYKVNSGTQTHLELMVAKAGEQGAAPVFVKKAIADGTQGQWATATFKASDFGLAEGDVIGTVGLSATATPANYELLLGEMAFVPAAFAEQPVQPVITSSTVLKRVYNRADFKVVFDLPFSGTRKAEYDNAPIYNEEVGAWYYEIWVKQGDQQTLLTTTTSWAAYVVDAPLDPAQPTFQIGVRTVGRDG